MSTSFLVAEGFELGSTFAENQLLSKNVWAQTAFVNATSTFTIGNSTMGSGKSLSVALYPSSTTTANRPGVNLSAGVLGASGGVGYTFSYGYQAKLNSSKTSTVGSGFGLRSTAVTSGFCMLNSTTAIGSSTSLTVYFGTAAIATITVPDLNAHSYDFMAVKTGTNVWSLSVWLDKVLAYSGTGLSAALSDTSLLGFYTDGSKTTVQANFFSEIDNLYLREGLPVSGLNLVKLTPNADVQAQWSRYGSGLTSNFQAVNKTTMDDSTGLTGAVGNTDWYSVSDTLPTGKQLAAVNVTAGGYGTGSDLITANARIGSTVVNSAAASNGAFGGAVNTGWDETLVGQDVASLQFGVSKTA